MNKTSSIIMFLFPIVMASYADIFASDQNPRIILRGAEKAIRDLRTVSYDVESHILDSNTEEKATRRYVDHGHVTLRKLPVEDPIGAKLSITGEIGFQKVDEEPLQVTTTYDGVEVRKLDHGWKTVLVGNSLEKSMGLLRDAIKLVMSELKSDNPFDAERNASTIQYEGVSTVNGINCHVVYVEYDTSQVWQPTGRWYIGISDHIPRKFEGSSISSTGKKVRTMTLSNVIVNADVSDKTFKLDTPLGYTERSYSGAPTETVQSYIGAKAPDWRLTDSTGRRHRLSEYRDKIVIMDFWATWCSPCLRGMPELQWLHDNYKAQDVVVFGISTREKGDAAAYMRQHNYTYGLLLDGDMVDRQYHVPGLPTLFVIGYDGTILKAEVGFKPGDYKRLSVLIDEYRMNTKKR